MCKFCSEKRAIAIRDNEDEYSLLIDEDRAYLYDLFNNPNTFKDIDSDNYFEINYCPMCGRKLC